MVPKNTSYVSSILYKNKLQKYIFLCSFFLRCFHFRACCWTAEHWVTVLRVIPTCTVTCYTRFLPINFIPPPRVHILYIETNEYHKFNGKWCPFYSRNLYHFVVIIKYMYSFYLWLFYIYDGFAYYPLYFCEGWWLRWSVSAHACAWKIITMKWGLFSVQDLSFFVFVFFYRYNTLY